MYIEAMYDVLRDRNMMVTKAHPGPQPSFAVDAPTLT
jgi:hypothetical protein